MTSARITFFLLSVFIAANQGVAQQHGGSQNSDSLYFHSLRLQRAGRFEEARMTLRSLLNQFPLYHDARLLYGRLLAWDDLYQSAVVQIDSVLFFQPSNAEARFTKAQILAWGGRYRSSADILLALCEEDPQSAVYKAELAKVYLWGGSPEKALERYEEAYFRNPNSPDILRGLARAHRQLRSFDLSRRWYERLLEREPGDIEAHSEIIRLSYRSEVEVQLQGSYETFSSPGVTAHSIGQAEIYASPNEDWKPFIHYSRVSKFSLSDNRFGLGSYLTLGYSLTGLFQGIVSPNPRVAPSLDMCGELSWGVADGFELTGGYRYLTFDSLEAHVLQPGATWYVNAETWLTAKAYVGLTSTKTTSTSVVGVLNQSVGVMTVLKIGAFIGTEAFRATTMNELSALKTSGGFIGLKSRLSKLMAVDLHYQYASRSSPSDSHLAIVTVSFLF